MKQKAFIFVILAGVLWGTSGIFVHYLSPFGFSSIQMSAVRGGVSFVILALYALVRDRSLFRVNLKHLLLFALNGIALFGTASCYFFSMQATSISTAVVLMYMAPIYVTVFSVLFLGERFSAVKAVSVACMLVGCALVSGIVGGLKADAFGIGMGVLSGICYGSYNIITKIAMRSGAKPLSATVYTFFFMFVIAFSVSEPLKIAECAAKDPAITLPLMLGIGIFTFIMPYVLYTLALKELPAGTASALSIVEPMSASLFGIFLFSEPVTVFSVCGILLILFAVFMFGKAEGSADKQK